MPGGAALHHSPYSTTFSTRFSADSGGSIRVSSATAGRLFAETPTPPEGKKPRESSLPSSVSDNIMLQHIRRLAVKSSERHPFEEPELADLVAVGLPSGLGEGMRKVSGWSVRLGETAPEFLGGRLRKILEMKEVELLVAVVITFNCFFMVLAVDYEAAHIGERVPVGYLVGEASFFLFYLIEVILKLLCYQFYYFFGEDWQFNWMDLVQVIGGGFSLADSIFSHGDAINVQWLRSLRVFRLLRILRVLRVVQRFKHLRCILLSIVGSMSTLTWSLVMVLVFVYVFSMFFVQRTSIFFVDGADVEDHARLRVHFGSVYASMETLFAVATGGMDWMEAYDSLRPIGWFTCTVFMFHIVFIQFSLVNIVTGMFVEQAMKSMSGDNHQKALQHSMEERQLGNEFRLLCNGLARVHGDRISREEWEQFISKPTSHSYLEMLGWRSHDVLEFFLALNTMSDDDTVDIDEFVSGCLRMKGAASCFDTQALLAEIRFTKQAILESQRQLKSQKITRQRTALSPRG